MGFSDLTLVKQEIGLNPSESSSQQPKSEQNKKAKLIDDFKIKSFSLLNGDRQKKGGRKKVRVLVHNLVI